MAVRWNDEGELEFRGRIDLQVQIGGHRVELGEIENVLSHHPDVAEVCCTPIKDGELTRSVVAHVVTDASSAQLTDRLRDFLNAELPTYMIPSEFVFHKNLPRTGAGKLDRVVLAAHTSRTTASLPRPCTGSFNDELVLLWHDLLPKGRDGEMDTSFWELGGDSLTLIQLSLGVEEITGRQLSLPAFLKDPTLDGLLNAVEELSVRDLPKVVRFRDTGSRHPVFCMHTSFGGISIYAALAEALGDDQPVFGVPVQMPEQLSKLPFSMEEAAAEIIGRVRQTTSNPAPAFVGWSWDGLLAFEVARQWIASTPPVRCRFSD